MIYNEEFIWLHVPKCAGAKTEKLFKKYYSDDKSIHQGTANPGVDLTVKWHDSINKRMDRDDTFTINNRRIILPIRRLPSWLISYYNDVKKRKPNLEINPEDTLNGKFTHVNGIAFNADCILRQFMPSETLDNEDVSFIRMEHLKSDFIGAFKRFIDTEIIDDDEFSKKVNYSNNAIPHELENALYSDLPRLYKCCPHWSKVEELAYGDLGF